MKIMMAPMEGVGGYVYRNAFDKYFGPLDGYITPFVGNGSLMNRERRDIDPANNRVSHIIPQIMGGNAEGFLKVSEEVAALGYTECNVNLGCPSGTVTGKGRGSGMLKNPKELDDFCNSIFKECSMKLSVKTRIGSDSPDEWPEILKVLASYPWESVTIHPRTRLELYKGPIHLDAFELAYKEMKAPLIFNGELRTKDDVEKLICRFPDIEGVMIGRGFLMAPWLSMQLRMEEPPSDKALVSWHRELLNGYREYIKDDRSLLFKMKDLWNFLGESFTEEAKVVKTMKKTSSLQEFTSLAEKLLHMVKY